MGRRRGGDKIHNKNKELRKSDFKRRVNDKKTVADIIIACEDSISSPTYFRMMIQALIDEKKITQDSVVIVPHDGSTHPTGVLANLKSYDVNNKSWKEFEHKWIVIDRDSKRVNGGGHEKEDFNNTLKNAKSSKSNLTVEVAYSNDSFELWYLLHFDYRDTAILRDDILKQVIKKLKEQEPHKFSKLNKDNMKQENYTKLIFDTLKPLQAVALKNGKKLIESYGEGHNPENDNPSTTVHDLVKLSNTLHES